MTRPADPRGASRRGATDAADLGYTVANDAPASRHKPPMRPHRPAPVDHGCHCYEVRGVAYTRCAAHAPAGGCDCGPVRGACPGCISGT